MKKLVTLLLSLALVLSLAACGGEATPDASVNGFMADPFYATSVSAGKCAFSSMAWSDTTLEENGITEVEEIEVLFRAYDADDFMGEDFANEVITLNP